MGYGSGVGIERPYQRRNMAGSNSLALSTGRSGRLEADTGDGGGGGGGDDEWNEDGGDDAKDD